MSLINFGAGNSQQGVFSRIKPYPTPNIQSKIAWDCSIPVVRSGNKNYFRPMLQPTGHADLARYLRLYTTNPDAMVVEVDFNTVTAGARWLTMCISSADSCMYVVVRGTDTLIRLVKVSDTTGAITSIGSGFTPSTPTNWQLFSTLEDLGTSIRLKCNGVYHDIVKATGAVASEDTAFGIVNALLPSAVYTSLDGSIVASNLYYLNTVAYTHDMLTPEISHASVGTIDNLSVSSGDVFGSYITAGGSTTGVYPIVLVDNDKIAFSGIYSGANPPIHIATRVSYDAFLQSIVNYAAGL